MAASAACRSPPRGSEGTGRTRARAGFAGPECQSSRLCARTVFSWSRQCRQPAPSAPWRRAPAPRAGGGRAAFRFGWGGGGSRRRQAHEQGPAACGALGDAALPRWARGAAGGRIRRCLPCGQRRFRVGAPDHGVSREKAGPRSVLPIRLLCRRAGERGRRAFPRKGDGDTRHPANETHPYPATPSTSTARGKRGALQGTSSCHRFSRRTSGA